MEKTFIDNIVKLCVKKYKMLPKTGKPTDEEWTVVSAIVEDTGCDQKVVALGTGSKCVGVQSLSPQGDILHDSHAEVMARRGFLLYLLSEVESSATTHSRVFQKIPGGGVELREDVKFWFVCSAVPCGDAAIIPKTSEGRGKLAAEDAEQCSSSKKQRLSEGARADDDIHRTGAKCLPDAQQDSRSAGTKYHITGQVRTKPGRGDPTASVSCSDKLARWNAVGVQGALLSLLLHQPIFFNAIIIAGKSPYSEESLERAINYRINASGKMKFYYSSISFGVEKDEARTRPGPCSISYHLPADKPQIAVEGRRLGATKKNSAKSALTISKSALYKRFCDIIFKYSLVPESVSAFNVRDVTYRQMKDLSVAYQDRWAHFKKKCFKIWTIKPCGLEDFKLKG